MSAILGTIGQWAMRSRSRVGDATPIAVRRHVGDVIVDQFECVAVDVAERPTLGRADVHSRRSRSNLVTVLGTWYFPSGMSPCVSDPCPR